MIINCIKPDTTIRTAAHVAAHTSHMLNGTSALVNFACGEDGTSSMYKHSDQEDGHGQEHEREHHLLLQEEYIDEETEDLKEKGRDDLLDLFKNNQKFR